MFIIFSAQVAAYFWCPSMLSLSLERLKPSLQLNSLLAKLPSFSISTIKTIPEQCDSINDAKRIHQQLIVNGLVLSDPTRILRIYMSCDAHSPALALLRRLPPSPYTVYWWNSLIRHSVREKHPEHALEMYISMHRLGWRPDDHTFPFVLKACGEIPSFIKGCSVHGSVCASGFDLNVFVCNGLISMYSRCGDLDSARKVFDEMSQRGIGDVVSWNSIVAAYVQSGHPRMGLNMFGKMSSVNGCFCADAVSLVNVISACSSVGAWVEGMQAHGYAVRAFLIEDVFVGNAIVYMYAKCGLMDEASRFFLQMKVKDVVSWNAMVTGYSQIGRFEDALSLFEKMRNEKIELNVVTWSAVIAGYAQRDRGHEALDVFRQMFVCGSNPNAVTLVSLLSACACVGTLSHGKETHCYAIKCILNGYKNDPEDDQMVINSLIDMYAKCKGDKFAHIMFDSILPEDRNVVTWTVMIGGHAQKGDPNDALELFSKMLNQKKYVKPNAFTMSCVLMASARLATLRIGRQIHCYVIRNSYESTELFVTNCLIDMYSKSGDVDAAQFVFDKMSQRNSVSWTSLMTGYGMHGRGAEALYVFDGMRKAGLPIDGVTFIVVLYACSHSGMVDQGMKYFDGMSREYGIVPEIEHYACVVDLLGRAGRLQEAMELIKEMHMEPSPIIWFSLLSACRTHKNVELGEYAADQLLKSECENDGSYTLLSNIYANARRWKDVARIRSLMKNTGIRKRPGWSWVQGKKGTVTFYVGDRSHPLSPQIYVVLADLIDRIKPLGYVPDTQFALHDVDEEEKGDLLFEHSEKLALAYGILTSAPGLPIRITKNLRVCGDCHIAFNFISKIIDHEIILRDSSRFHHFKNGSCSCRGYW